jgi:hypothetical protein
VLGGAVVFILLLGFVYQYKSSYSNDFSTTQPLGPTKYPVTATPTLNPSPAVIECLKKSALISKAWYYEDAKQFCLPPRLVPFHQLQVPQFGFVDVASNDTDFKVHPHTDHSLIHQAIETKGFLPLISLMDKSDPFTIGIVTFELFVWLEDKEEKDRLRIAHTLERIPKVENLYYFISLKFWDQPNFEKFDSLNRTDFLYSDYDFGKYNKPYFHGITYPYIDIIPDNYDPSIKKTYLIFFRGMCHHKVRSLLSQMFINNWDDDIIVEWKSTKGTYDQHDNTCNKTRAIPGFKGNTSAIQEDYFRLLKASKFCLLPSGDVDWTMRLLDTVASGCIPIFIANNLTLPFDDIVPWKKISLFFPTELLHYVRYKNESWRIIVDYLRSFTDEELLPIQQALHEVFINYFVDGAARAKTTLHSLLLQHKNPITKRFPRFNLSSNPNLMKFASYDKYNFYEEEPIPPIYYDVDK